MNKLDNLDEIFKNPRKTQTTKIEFENPKRPIASKEIELVN